MDKFELNFWNSQYYAKVRMPDGSLQEIKSATDLTYTQWKEKIEQAWTDSQIPAPPAECICSQCLAKVCPLKAIEEVK